MTMPRNSQENTDPTKDPAFKKVVDYFLRTPPKTQEDMKKGRNAKVSNKPKVKAKS